MLLRRLSLPLIVAITLLSACGGDGTDTDEAAPVVIDDTYSPAPTLEDAVSRMLEAEQRMDHTTSFALLTPEARKEYESVPIWTDRRRELPRITGFRLEDGDGDRQPAVVSHVAELDPFIGLAAAEERQTWIGQEVEGGWLLAAEPENVAMFPPDDKAPDDVTAWVAAVQACNRELARSLQAVETLFGAQVPALCNVSGEITVGVPGPLTEGPGSAAIVAAYSGDALTWARTVPVFTPVPLNVVVAPIGNDWRVIGVS